jgi:hypothetical protein
METNNNTITNESNEFLDGQDVSIEQDTIQEVQKYFDIPLQSNSCCENQHHLFMLEGLSWTN